MTKPNLHRIAIGQTGEIIARRQSSGDHCFVTIRDGLGKALAVLTREQASELGTALLKLYDDKEAA